MRFTKGVCIALFASLISACSDDSSSTEEMEVLAVMQDMKETSSEVPRECTSTHSKIGQTGELSTIAHSVSGTVTVVDDCTIEITNFNYDGLGLVVEIYAGIDSDYTPPTGFAISRDLAGTSFENETLTVQLPTGKTLDDLNGISVWCSDVYISFGDTLIN
jgi:hypothetical protein